MDENLVDFFKKTAQNNWDSIYVQNVYGVHPPDFENAYVLDVGANIGIFSHLALDMGAKWVFSIEPSQGVYSLLLQHAHKRMTPLQWAVSSTPGFANVVEGSGLDSSYIIPSQNGQVPVVTLESVMGLIPGGSKVLVKIDNEGSEYDTLFSTSKACLDRISTLCVEFHDTQSRNLPEYVSHVKKHPLHTEATLLQYLLKMGFFSVWSMSYYELRDGQPETSPISIRKFVH